MNDIETTRTDRIRTLHAEIGGYLRTTIGKAIEVGGLLAEQKAELEHGQWGAWVQEHLPFSARLARDYMRFYERRDDLKTANLADLTDARRYLTGPSTSQTGRDDYLPDPARIFVLLLMYTWWYMIPDAEQENTVAELREKAQRIATHGPAYDPGLCWDMHQDENPYLRMALPHHKYVAAFEAWERGDDPSGSMLIMLGWPEEEFERRLVRGEEWCSY